MAIDFETSSSQWLNLGTTLAALQNVAGGTIIATVMAESQGGASVTRNIVAIATGTSTTSNRAGLRQVGASGTDGWGTSARRLDADSVQTATATTSVATATATHLAAVMNYDGASLILYQNGASAASAAPAAWTANTSNTSSDASAIGATSDGATLYFDGVICSVRVYNTDLSAAAIANLAVARGRDSWVQNLVHWWPMNEGYPGQSVSTAYDRMGVQNGSPNNTPVYAEACGYPHRPRRRSS